MDAAQRTEAWRKSKRKAGYSQVVLWLPREVKGEFTALAATRGQDLATCFADALHALMASQGTRKPTRLDGHERHVLTEEITALVLRRLGASPGDPVGEAEGSLPAVMGGMPEGVRLGGKPGVPLETLTAIMAERKQYPSLSLNKFAEHLHEMGIYSSTARVSGATVPAQGGTIQQLLARGQRLGLG